MNKKDCKDFSVRNTRELGDKASEDIKSLARDLFGLSLVDEHLGMRHPSLAFAALQAALIFGVQEMFPKNQWVKIADELGKSIKRSLEENMKIREKE